MYAFELCAAISDDFRNSPEMAAHDLDTYIFTFTKIGMLSPQFSVQRPAFLKAVFQCESFDVGLIRVGEECPKVRVMVLNRLIHLFFTYLTYYEDSFWKDNNFLGSSNTVNRGFNYFEVPNERAALFIIFLSFSFCPSERAVNVSLFYPVVYLILYR